MVIDNRKLDLALARQCKTSADLQPGVSPQTIYKIRQGKSVRPDVVGRISNALGVMPADIVEES